MTLISGITGVLAALAAASSATATHPVGAARTWPVTVTAKVEGVRRSVPGSYLGFSVEWTELPGFDADTRAFARLLGLLSVDGQPVPVRIGGDTADNTYLPQAKRRAPVGAYVVHDDSFTRLGQLARATRLSLLFDLNLAARSPQMAQAVGRELQRAVPRSSVTGFEIGNEPDLYPIGVIGNRFIKHERRSPFQWALTYGPSAYASDFARYVGALRPIWPHVRYAGPAVISGRKDFAQRTLRTRKASMLTVHRYQYSVCSGRSGSSSYPSERAYLSSSASRSYAAKDRPLVSLARRAGVPLRVTEFGSAICGGRAGLTNTYATALWAADTIFSLMAQGVDGVNVHLRQVYPNSALNASPAGIAVNPLYYGMLLVTKTLGPGAQLMNVTSSPASANATVWAVRDRHQATRVLLLNEGRHDVQTKLAVGVSGDGSIQRLTAPAPNATTHVQFAGQSLDSTGNWIGTPQTELAHNTRGTFTISLPHYSAALLAVPG